MYRIYLLLLSALLMFASCSEHPQFVRNDIQICQTEGFTGYFVPDGIGSHGLLYVDRGKLYAEEYRVEISKRFGKTYVKGEELESTRCTLTRYTNPASHIINEGVDYLHPHYKISTTREVEYGRANGYWTSYPYDNSGNYGRIVMDKLEDLLRNEQEEQSLRLDVYSPDDEGNHLRPLLVMIHEGAFFSGDKADDASSRWCEQFASCGYVAVSVNYRLGFNLFSYSVSEAAYSALQDVNAAIRYLLAHRVTYRIDPDKIFLAGCSAGAIVALNTAFLNDSNIPESMQEVAAKLGPLSSIPVTPAYDEPFAIRAVGNMWGAVLDPEILKSSHASIISFHGKYDPVVPFGEGIPFEPFVKEMLREMPGGSWAGGYLAKKVMPMVYGSSCVDAEAKKIGKLSELHSYNIHKHTLVRNEDTGELNELHKEFFEKMNTFFVDEMIGQPVTLQHSFSDAQLFKIEHPDNVKDCSWSIQDGFITESLHPTQVRVLLKGESYNPVLTVKGVYSSDIAFDKSWEMKEGL